MKKYVTFFMRDKKLNVTLPFEQAERVIDSPQQLVKIMENGVWTGLTINKAEIIGTDRDSELEGDRNAPLALPEPTRKPIRLSDHLKLKPDSPDWLTQKYAKRSLQQHTNGIQEDDAKDSGTVS